MHDGMTQRVELGNFVPPAFCRSSLPLRRCLSVRGFVQRIPPARRFYRLLALLGGCCLANCPARAILFYSTADPAYNTQAPTGALAGSGWQYVGNCYGWACTAIAPDLIITAQHVGIPVGAQFVMGGISYPTIDRYLDTNSDLAIYKVCGTLPQYAPIYGSSDEVGRRLVVIGNGTQRGAPVTVTGGVYPGMKGWLWGSNDRVTRWGENTVAGIYDEGGSAGQLLQVSFDANAGPNEGTLSTGDSGGPVFIQTTTGWALAGINYAVNSPFNTTNSGAGFNAAIFDARGLYILNGTSWDFISGPSPIPAAFYASRISGHLAWINEVIASEGNNPPEPILEAAATVKGPYTQLTGATVDSGTQTIRAPIGSALQFFRLNSCHALLIKTFVVQGGFVQLSYE